ncbi:nuclear transport factor 2 family protein [Nocardiopsis valliformis]|uniref:nuclear transport factor 2 family protein n=1 Tax=Nocardiopsis valliformis TaxID=239974 RepID=UPI00034BF41F|nr:nuclear transport factor 2 family protein [Nocardiopsis valliformis]
MATTSSGTGFDLDTFRRALEEGDTDTLISQFADDADIETVDRRTPPSMPTVIHGRDSIEYYMRQVYSMDTDHEILQCVMEGDHAAYTERCTYPDGLTVMSMTMLDLTDGRITHQSTVQAWDEEAPDTPRVVDFATTDARVEFDHGHTEAVRLGGQFLNRMTLEPGWRWSEHRGAEAGTDLCMRTHTCLGMEGTLAFRTADGEEQRVGPGQVAFIPPGHDAWVEGDEPAVIVEWSMDR